jgi:glycosyltransferase involved in cell wall biosynthesis
MKTMSLSEPSYLLCIFTKNEENTIESLAAEVQKVEHQPQSVIVIDDSTDSTKKKIRSLRWIEVPGEGNLGAAYRKALQLAASFPVDWVVTMDGDGQADPNEIPRFLAAAQSQQADLVLGSRFLKKNLIQYPYPILNRLGVLLLSTYLSVETKQRVTDSHGGLRCHSRTALARIQVYGQHTYVQESIVSAKRNGLTVIEIPSVWRARTSGRSKVVGSVLKYAIKVTPQLLRCSRINFFRGFRAEPEKL